LTSLGKAFFEQYRTGRNHCEAQTQPTDPSPCVQYQGCDEPAIWCEFSGGHDTWSQSPQAIWNFFAQF
jgi:polyhydroxybutyrate depolymerase